MVIQGKGDGGDGNGGVAALVDGGGDGVWVQRRCNN